MAKIYKTSQKVPLSAVVSISSELVIPLDCFLRIIVANEPFCALVGTDRENLLEKTSDLPTVPLIFDELFVRFFERIREGIPGRVIGHIF